MKLLALFTVLSAVDVHTFAGCLNPRYLFSTSKPSWNASSCPTFVNISCSLSEMGDFHVDRNDRLGDEDQLTF